MPTAIVLCSDDRSIFAHVRDVDLREVMLPVSGELFNYSASLALTLFLSSSSLTSSCLPHPQGYVWGWTLGLRAGSLCPHSFLHSCRAAKNVSNYAKQAECSCILATTAVESQRRFGLVRDTLG